MIPCVKGLLTLPFQMVVEHRIITDGARLEVDIPLINKLRVRAGIAWMPEYFPVHPDRVATRPEVIDLTGWTNGRITPAIDINADGAAVPGINNKP